MHRTSTQSSVVTTSDRCPELLGRVQERLREAGVLELSLGGWIGFQSGGVSPGKEQRRQQGGVKRHLKEELEKAH